MLHCCFGADASSSSPLLHCSATAPGAPPLLLPTAYPQLPRLHAALLYPRRTAPPSPCSGQPPRPSVSPCFSPQCCSGATTNLPSRSGSARIASVVAQARRGQQPPALLVTSAATWSSRGKPSPRRHLLPRRLSSAAAASRSHCRPSTPPHHAPTTGRPCHLLTLP